MSYFTCPGCGAVVPEERIKNGRAFCRRDCSASFRQRYGAARHRFVEHLIVGMWAPINATEFLGVRKSSIANDLPYHPVMEAINNALASRGRWQSRDDEVPEFDTPEAVWDWLAIHDKAAELWRSTDPERVAAGETPPDYRKIISRRRTSDAC